MADLYTDSAALTDTIKTAYDRNAMFALRHNLVFAQLANVRPGNVTNPGTPVTFTFWSDLSDATTALSETVDVDAVALSDSQVSITPAEYGNAIIVPIKAKTDTFLIGFDPDASNILNRNMVQTIDSLARTALDGSGGVITFIGDTTASGVVSTDILTADLVREQHADLAAAAAEPLAGGYYGAYVHPHVTYDLKSETGDGAWIGPHQYVDTMNVYNNEIGTFGGFRFIETARATLVANGASSNVDLYTSYFIGKDALGEAVSIPPHTVIGPVVDKLRRMQPLGWYAYLGFDTIRAAALQLVKGASSIGAN